MAERFRLCFDLPHYSPGRAAETITTQLRRLQAPAEALDGTRGAPALAQLGDLLLELRTLLAWAAPILIDVAAELTAVGVDLGLSDGYPHAIPAFGFPRLPCTDGSAQHRLSATNQAATGSTVPSPALNGVR